MSGLATLLKKLAGEHGVELDDDELADLGLSEGGEHESPTDLELSELDGSAAGAAELFVSEPRTWLAAAPAETSEGTWEPIIREGQWAVRPGGSGQKKRTPLQVVAGRSKNQRKQIGLQDLVDAFDAEAIEHVTVPTSHQNDVTQNTGFIRKLKLVDGTYKPKGSKTPKKVKVLMGLYDIKLPDIKEKMDLGAIASRSAGLLYDYVDTERGKTWPVVLEHVALTNKPWITGMKAFGRKLVKGVKSTVGLSLSDEEPTDEEKLAHEDALESIELADTSITWDKDDDPDWLRARVNCALDEARAVKIAAYRAKFPAGAYVETYDYPPRYRCVKARPGLALIADGWGDEANCWTAPFSVVEGDVELEADLEKWTASKRVYIPDDARKQFEEGEEPLADEPKADPPVQLTPLQLAQKERRERNNTSDDEPQPPRGGEQHMANENTLQLSEEARRIVQAAEDRAKAAEERASNLEQKIEALAVPVRKAGVDEYINELKAMGFSEEHGFSGVLVEVREQMLADDGGPALQSDHFTDDKTNKTGELTYSEGIKRIFAAIKKTEDGKADFGVKLAQPSENAEELGEDGKPKDKEPVVEEKRDFSQLSQDEQLADLAKDNPHLAEKLGIKIPEPVADANGSGSEQKGGE